MSSRSKRPTEPGTVFTCPKSGKDIRINDYGEEEPFVPIPWDPFREYPSDDRQLPRRADGTVAPFYSMTHDQLERWGQDTPRTRRKRHDGWTLERQKEFIERLAETASVTDAARYVGMSRQSARNLYNRSAHFRAAWDEALRMSLSVLAETAFDRAVNGVQEQVFYHGRMVGFREKYNDRLLMFLLRVRDPLNYAPLDDLQGWQRHRALEDKSGDIGPALDRLEAAEKAWAQAHDEPPALPHPADGLGQPTLAASESEPPALPDDSQTPHT